MIVALLVIIGVIALAVGIFIYSNNTNLSCHIQETRTTPISLDQANSVALEHVNNNNRPFSWVNVGHYLVRNSFDESNYYIFIFRKSDVNKFNTLEKLEENAKLFSDTNAEDTDQKLQVNDIATVITGTMNEDKLIIRNYRGIPASMAKKIEIKEFVEKKFSGLTIGELYYDSEMDQGYYEIMKIDSKKPTGDVIKVVDNSIVPRSDLIKYQEKLEQRKQERYSSLSKDECEQLKNGILERNADLDRQWSRY